MTDYGLCGWRVSSELTLPELPEWTGDDRAPDLEIVFGPVPAAIAQPVLTTAVLELDAAGNARFSIKAVADYWIEGGRRITIAPHMDRDAPDIRLFLLGTPWGLVCHQHGLVPLHAAAVEVDGEALILAGPSGVGKSTLAAAFWRRGHRLLADDIAPFALTEGGALLMPGLARVRLWQDSLEAVGLDAQAMEPCRAGIAKFSQPVARGSPLRPAALVHLERHPESAGAETFQRLRGRAAVGRAFLQVYRTRTMGAVIDNADSLRRVTRLAAAIPHHFVLRRPVAFEELDAQVEMILDTVRSAQARAA